MNRSQIATGSQKRREPRFPPYAFTEHGAIQAAKVLNTPRAIAMRVYVVRAFVQLRELLASNTALARKLDELEGKIRRTMTRAITAILSAIRELMNPRAPAHRLHRQSHPEVVATAQSPMAQLGSDCWR